MNSKNVKEAAEMLPTQIEESMQLGPDKVESDLEIDEDYLEFLAITDKHRKEWKIRRKSSSTMLSSCEDISLKNKSLSSPKVSYLKLINIKIINT